MFDRYYVTGGTGFLGRAVLQKLAGAGAAVRALVLPGDPLLPLLPPEVQAVPGDLTDDASLDGFFEGAGPESCVIHCAGIISIATRPDCLPEEVLDLLAGCLRIVRRTG